MKELLVDPHVSLRKFEKQLAEYQLLENEYVKRGWWMVHARYPEVFVVFGSPNIQPPSVIFGAKIDFTNYDLWPPSVTLVDPFTQEPYKTKNLPTVLPHRVSVNLPGLPNELVAESRQNLMQTYGPEETPFLCLPGVREYHDHPAHTGDSWLLHKSKGEGTLNQILNVLYTSGVVPIKGYKIGVSVAGYYIPELP